MPIYLADDTAPVFMGVKSPNAALDYAYGWQDWLAPDEIIIDRWVTAFPNTLTVDLSIINAAPVDIEGVTYRMGSVVTAWLSGGILKAVYTVTCKILTSEGRTDERSFKLLITTR